MVSTNAPVFKIHPAIGIARIGDADPDQYFIGPETPGVPANWDFKTQQFLSFKHSGHIKRQAARFHIWEYVEKNGQIVPLREISLDDVQEITWTVHLANRKSSFYQFQGLLGEPDNYKTKPPLRNASVTGDSNRARQLEIDEGEKVITATKGVPPKIVEFKNSKPSIPIETLGELRTDDQGRLLVLGGKGRSASTSIPPLITDFSNNDHWFDDISDGPVKATIMLKGQTQKIVAEAAWVIVAPPDFAPAIGNIVTLYDTLYDLAARELSIAMVGGKPVNGIYGEYEYQTSSGTMQTSKGLKRLVELNTAWKQNTWTQISPSFTEEIFPILQRAYSMRWIYQPLHVQDPHQILARWKDLADNTTSGAAATLRDFVFHRIRNPDAPNQLDDSLMPRVFGDDWLDKKNRLLEYLTLTRTQYALLEQWHRGHFQSDWSPPAVPTQEQITPEGLDRAALENCVGGGFHPGFEVGWLIRKREIFSEPFRIKQDASLSPGAPSLSVRAGFFTQQMGIPWQADSHDCLRERNQNGHDFAWWPGQRPDDVYRSAANVAAGKMVSWTRNLSGSYLDMVNKWSTLRFVVKEGNAYIEQQET